MGIRNLAGEALDQTFDQAGAQHGIDPDWLRAIAQVETGNSNYAPDGSVVTSPTGVQGRMQFTNSTARQYNVTDRLDDTQTIPAAANLLSDALKRTGNDPMKALLSYNSTDPQYGAKVVKALSAIKAQRAQQPSQATPTASPYDAMRQELLSGATEPPAPAAPASGGYDDLRQELLGTPQENAAPSTPVAIADSAPASAPAPAPSRSRPLPKIGLSDQETADLRTGMNRAVDDVVNTPATLLARGADAIGLTGLLNRNGVAAPTGDQVAAQNAAGLAAYDQQAADKPIMSAGRLAGQMALTVPLAGGLGQVAEAGGNALAAGAGQVAPVLGRAVAGAGNFLAGQAGGAGNRLAQAASIGVNGAIQGGVAGGLTAGQSAAPLGQQVLSGAEAGGIVAPAARVAGAGLGAALGSGTSPDVAQLAQLARDKYKINLTADQITGSPFVQTLGAQLRQAPLTGMAGAQAELQGQFTKAVSRTIGEDTSSITPSVMEAAKKRIGGVMNDVASKTTIPVESDPQLLGQLGNIQAEAARTIPNDSAVANAANDVIDAAAKNGGSIPGDVYARMTAHNSPLDRLTKSADPNIKFYAGQVRDALDDALERAAPKDAVDALQEARLQYKNLKTIEPLVVTGQPGEISPNGLQAKVNTSFKGRGLRADQPDLAELADIGKRFNLVPDSGTARRSLINNLLLGGGGSAAGVAGYMDPNNLLYAGGAAVGAMGIGAGAGAALRSKTYIDSLINSGLAPTPGVINRLSPYAAPVAAVAGNRLRN